MKRYLTAILGIVLGLAFLWLAARDIERREFALVLSHVALAPIVASLACYWVALSLRVARWHFLLQQIRTVRRVDVAETLLIGYAVNNVLPARLGELFRADYAKRRFALSRTVILGSIVNERLLDLAVIVLCLALGLAGVNFGADTALEHTFRLTAITAASLIAVAAAVIALLRFGARHPAWLPSVVRRVRADLVHGFASLNRDSAPVSAVLSLGVWLGETFALWWMFRAVGVELSVAQALLVMGAASLSTLIPTAPGYIGTYQLVAAVAVSAFGYSATYGVIAATGVQLVLFGSVTLIGISLLLVRSMLRLQRTGAGNPD